MVQLTLSGCPEADDDALIHVDFVRTSRNHLRSSAIMEVSSVKAYIAVTDKRWFEHLRMLYRRRRADEVNFWTPNRWGGRFRVLERGQPLLFKLRSPDNAIVGGGFFEHYSDLPISLAWQSFGEKNGASSLAEIRQRTARLRRDHPRRWEDYTIGCILLAEPFFWEEKDWIPQPEDWAPSTQRGKGYDLRTQVGQRLWARVFDRLGGTVVSEPRPQQLGRSSGRLRRSGDREAPGGAGDLPYRRHRRVREAVRGNA